MSHANAINSPWKPERVELLKKLWAEGISAGKIAKELHARFRSFRPTRNAVIGKVHREGLPPRTVSPSKRLDPQPGKQMHPADLKATRRARARHLSTIKASAARASA